MSTQQRFKLGAEFLVTVEQGVLELQESCVNSILSRTSLNSQNEKFITLVGSQRTSGQTPITVGYVPNNEFILGSQRTSGQTPITVGYVPNNQFILGYSSASQRRAQGIVMFSQEQAAVQMQQPQYVTHNIETARPLILQPWAPTVDSETYTALIDFCVLVSTNASANSIYDYISLMRSTIERYNSSKSMNRTTSALYPVPVKVKEEIAAKIQLDYRQKFSELKTTLEKVIYLDGDALSREFNNFVEQIASNVVSVYLNQLHNQTTLKDVIASTFQNEFDSFRKVYSAKATKFSKLEDQLNAKFSKIEQGLKTAWRDDLLKEFLQSLPQRYMFDIGAFDFPSEDYNLMPQWQLRFTKRHDHHEKCVRSAVLVVQRVEKSLEASFTNYLTNPKTVAVPVKPTILEFKGAFNEITSLQSFVEEALSDKYNFMLQVSEGQNKKIQERLAETERALREETKRIFQLQVKGSPASTTAITLSKP